MFCPWSRDLGRTVYYDYQVSIGNAFSNTGIRNAVAKVDDVTGKLEDAGELDVNLRSQMLTVQRHLGTQVTSLGTYIRYLDHFSAGPKLTHV